MKITKISYERLHLKLSEPYTIAYETIEETTNFILKLETEGKWTAYGCSAPDVTVTGESPEQVEQAIKDIIIPYLKGKNPFTYNKILAELKELLGKKSSALAMVDIALHDLIAKKAEVPLYQLLLYIFQAQYSLQGRLFYTGRALDSHSRHQDVPPFSMPCKGLL